MQFHTFEQRDALLRGNKNIGWPHTDQDNVPFFQQQALKLISELKGETITEILFNVEDQAQSDLSSIQLVMASGRRVTLNAASKGGYDGAAISVFSQG